MITFELSCDKGHRFEGWFASREDFDAQLGDGRVICPLCDSTKITKMLSAVSVHTSKNSGAKPPPVPAGQGGGGAQNQSPSPQAFFSAVNKFVEKNFEDVGEKFADQALKMHKGQIEDRSIRGTSTEEEDQLLRDEGVEFSKMNLPKYDA